MKSSNIDARTIRSSSRRLTQCGISGSSTSPSGVSTADSLLFGPVLFAQKPFFEKLPIDANDPLGDLPQSLVIPEIPSHALRTMSRNVIRSGLAWSKCDREIERRAVAFALGTVASELAAFLVALDKTSAKKSLDIRELLR